MALFYVFERSFWILLKGVGYELMTFQFFAWFFRLPSCKDAPSFSCKTAKAWWWFPLKRRSRRRRHPRRKRRRRGLRRKVRQTRLNGELVWRAGVEPRTLPVNQSKTATVPKRHTLQQNVGLCFPRLRQLWTLPSSGCFGVGADTVRIKMCGTVFSPQI